MSKLHHSKFIGVQFDSDKCWTVLDVSPCVKTGILRFTNEQEDQVEVFYPTEKKTYSAKVLSSAGT